MIRSNVKPGEGLINGESRRNRTQDRAWQEVQMRFVTTLAPAPRLLGAAGASKPASCRLHSGRTWNSDSPSGRNSASCEYSRPRDVNDLLECKRKSHDRLHFRDLRYTGLSLRRSQRARLDLNRRGHSFASARESATSRLGLRKKSRVPRLLDLRGVTSRNPRPCRTSACYRSEMMLVTHRGGANAMRLSGPERESSPSTPEESAAV